MAERRARRRRRQGIGLWIALGAAGLVGLASITNTTQAIRVSADRLWEADWGRGDRLPAVENPAPAALRSRVLAILNDPDILAGAGQGVARAEYRFDGCVLEFEAISLPAACASAPETGVARAVERVDLRRLLTGPAHVEGGRILPAAGGRALRSELIYRWSPRVEVALDREMESYLLLDPPTFRDGSTAEKIALGERLTRVIRAGEIGPVIRDNHKMLEFCSGAEVVEPLRGRVVPLYPAPAAADALIAHLAALGRGPCRGTGWLFDW